MNGGDDVIDPNDFVAWLVTQPNARGTLYLEHVAKHYVSFLRNTPTRLDTPLTDEESDIFACENIKEFEQLRGILINSPNYKEVNEKGHGSFSAGLEAYRRYLTNLDIQKELLQDNSIDAKTVLPDELVKILTEDYANGFKFDTTTLRLLSEKSGTNIDEKTQAMLRSMMFRRTDDVYFLLDMIANAEVRREITDFADSWLDDFGCFEVSELYLSFAGKINRKCINVLEDFEAFYEYINKRYVRCVGYYGTRIARINKSVNDLSSEIAAKIITITHDEYAGTVDEDELIKRFPAFSLELLTAIIKEHAEELVKTEINGIVCYQTLDALGLSDEFSETLVDVLEQIDQLGLIPSEDVLHTALSINLGVNFKAEYNIPDDRAYRRLIDAYYKNAPKRKWLRGIFAEEHN
jgi:hypothetical protein